MKEDVMQIVRIGLDLAKYVFEVHGVDCQRGFLSAVVRKKLGLDLVSEIGKDGLRRYRIVERDSETA
jgi:hypothetical protein